jgi:hypothetical protein
MDMNNIKVALILSGLVRNIEDTFKSMEYYLLNKFENIIDSYDLKMKTGSPVDVFKDRRDYNLGLKRRSKQLAYKIFEDSIDFKSNLFKFSGITTRLLFLNVPLNETIFAIRFISFSLYNGVKINDIFKMILNFTNISIVSIFT